MKAYGVKRKDRGCCPGHDKFPVEIFSTNISQKAHTRDTKKAHRRERLSAKQSIRKELI